MNVTREIEKLNQKELELGTSLHGSWHDSFKDSAYIYVGNLPYNLNEGDLITVLSQFGEIVHLELGREDDTGKSKGFAFAAYEDQRSTVLAVDNLNGSTLLGRTIRVDHKKDYKKGQTKDEREMDPELLLAKRREEDEKWKGKYVGGPQGPPVLETADEPLPKLPRVSEPVEDLDATELKRRYEAAKRRVTDVETRVQRKDEKKRKYRR